MGWVADLINRGLANPGDMLCPTSPCVFSEKWNDVYEFSGVSTTVGDGTLDPPTVKLTLAETQEAYRAGYNTNYATSWYLVRTSMEPGVYPTKMKSFYEGLLGRTLNPNELGNPKARADTFGPLRKGVLDNAHGTTLDRIPLVADANYGDFGEATITYGLGPIKPGAVGCESFSDGPIVFPAAFTGLAYDTAGQDYVDFAPYHGGGRQMGCNILFADGHVARIVDKNGDTIIGYTGNTADSLLVGDSSELDGIYTGSLIGAARSGKL